MASAGKVAMVPVPPRRVGRVVADRLAADGACLIVLKEMAPPLLMEQPHPRRFGGGSAAADRAEIPRAPVAPKKRLGVSLAPIGNNVLGDSWVKSG
jgi:hypothetical protein